MAKPIIDPKKLGEAIAEQMAQYGEAVVEAVDAVGEESIKKLVKLTKQTAPERSGAYRRALTYKKHPGDYKESSIFEWGAKAPHYRLTHLLVKGHQMKHGGRTAGDPFLADALAVVLPEYERNVEEAIKNA